MTEEVLFRSYLLSGLALILKYRYLAITVSSLMFALMHIGNPENEKFGYVLMFFFYFGTALILGVIAVLDEGIEQTIGIHIATNMYGALFVNFNDAALKTDSLFIIDNPMGINMVILNFISFLIYLILSKLCFKLKPISFIFKKII
jgi:membrane protease YdiL (CAAX protease family)